MCLHKTVDPQLQVNHHHGPDNCGGQAPHSQKAKIALISVTKVVRDLFRNVRSLALLLLVCPEYSCEAERTLNCKDVYKRQHPCIVED